MGGVSNTYLYSIYGAPECIECNCNCFHLLFALRLITVVSLRQKKKTQTIAIGTVARSHQNKYGTISTEQMENNNVPHRLRAHSMYLAREISFLV